MMGHTRDVIELLARDMRAIFTSTGTFAIHRAGDRPMLTVDHVTAFENIQDRSQVHAVVVQHLMRAEATAPGAGVIAGLTCVSSIETALHNWDEPGELISVWSRVVAEHRTSLALLASNTRRPTWDEVVIQAAKRVRHEELDLLTCVLDAAGPSARVFIEASPEPVTAVERTSGYTFSLSPPPAMAARCPWRRSSVRVCAIDGVIESVTELNRLMQTAHESRQPVFLVARAFAPEVIGTLALNMSRGTLDVMAVPVGFDIESMNTIVDIATVCGSDMVSSLRGDMVSAVDVSSLNVVDFVSVDSGRVSIECHASASPVREHCARLLEKSREAENADIRRLLECRIRSLSSGHVRAAVSASDDPTGSVRESLSRALSTVNATRLGGIVAWPGSCASPCDMLAPGDYPAVSLAVGMTYGLQAAETVLSSFVSL